MRERRREGPQPAEQRRPPPHVGQTRGDKGASFGRLDLLTSEGLRAIHLLSSHNRRVCQDEVCVQPLEWPPASYFLLISFKLISRTENTRRHRISSAALIAEEIRAAYFVEPKREES